LPAAIARSLHAGHGTDATGIVESDRDCPIGTALSFAAIPNDNPPGTVTPQRPALTVPVVRTHYSSVSRFNYRSRAPPA
jgi:hypothetical protein